MKEIAIQIENLSKEYLLDDKFKLTFRERLKNKKGKFKKIKALTDINLAINKGDVVGIIGNNGSGKSTLLKIISGITKPSKGSVKIAGKVASILEVGTGFNPELSGRENIYFSASILGMSAKATKKLEEEIIQFSELQDFIDMQVKYFSSGMFMRLAFAVIASIEADILLLDEVFSVGDAEFRRKSKDKILELVNQKHKTVLIVSHEMSTISEICKKFVWLKNGSIQDGADSIQTVTKYLSEGVRSANWKEENGSEEKGDLKIQKNTISKSELIPLDKPNCVKAVEVKNVESEDLGNSIQLSIYTPNNSSNIQYFQPVFIRCDYEKLNLKKIHPVFILTYQLSSFSVVCNSKYNVEESNINTLTDGIGSYSAICKIPGKLLNNGLFGVSVYFLDNEGNECLYLNNSITFEIDYDPCFATKYTDKGSVSSPIKPMLSWEITKSN